MRWDLRPSRFCCGWRAIRANRFPRIAGWVLNSSNGNPAATLPRAPCAYHEDELVHSAVSSPTCANRQHNWGLAPLAKEPALIIIKAQVSISVSFLELSRFEWRKISTDRV